MFGPSPDDAPMLLTDIQNTLTLYENEYQPGMNNKSTQVGINAGRGLEGHLKKETYFITAT